MIGIGLIIGVAALITAGAFAAVKLAPFWKKLTEWVNHIFQKLSCEIQQAVQGSLFFLQKISEHEYQRVSQFFSKLENGRWKKTKYISKPISVKDIPTDMHLYRNGESLDITDEYERQLLEITENN